MRLPEMKTLITTAVGVAFAGVTGMMYFQLKQLDDISHSSYFKEAFKILRSHSAAVHHLGEPIKQKGFRLSDQNNILTSDRAKFRINVSGPKDKGKMHLWAVPVDGNWSITRIELEVNKLPDRRLLIKDGPKNEEAPADQ